MNLRYKVLLIGEEEIKNKSLISYNVEPKILSRTIIDTSNLYLRPILGNTLFDSLLNEVYNVAVNSASLSPATKELLEEYIHPYLSQAVLTDLMINLQYRIDNKGTMKYNDTSATSISSEELEYAKNYHDNRSAGYKATLLEYLQTNNLVTDCNADKDVTTDSIGWFLEGSYRGGCSNN